MDWIKALTATPLNELTRSELVLPQHANHYGTLFGPNALALMGKAAFLAAARHTRQPVVMASATQVDFLKPVPVGALLHVHGRVTRVGTCSMSVFPTPWQRSNTCVWRIASSLRRMRLRHRWHIVWRAWGS